MWPASTEQVRKGVLKTCISLVICPEIRKWVKIWSWGFFRDVDKSSKNDCNWEFFVLAGVFCSKLLFFAKKILRKNFLKLLSKILFTTPPNWMVQKVIRFWTSRFWITCAWCVHIPQTVWSDPGTLQNSQLLFYVPTRRIKEDTQFLPQHLEKKVVKTGGVVNRHDLLHLS